MSETTLALLAVAIAGVAAVGAVLLLIRRNWGAEPEDIDYRAYFYTGVVTLAFAAVLSGILAATTGIGDFWFAVLPLLGVGAVFTYMGWSSRDEWPER